MLDSCPYIYFSQTITICETLHSGGFPLTIFWTDLILYIKSTDFLEIFLVVIIDYKTQMLIEISHFGGRNGKNN